MSLAQLSPSLFTKYSSLNLTEINVVILCFPNQSLSGAKIFEHWKNIINYKTSHVIPYEGGNPLPPIPLVKTNFRLHFSSCEK